MKSRALAPRRREPLTRYNPQKGLQQIAVAEVAEKHYARAKDPSQLKKAIRAKLEAQAEFVAWWDTQGPGVNHGGLRAKGKKQDNRSVILPDVMTVSRWRKHVGTAAALDATELAALSRYVKILEFTDDLNERLKASLSNEWYTPARYVCAARRVLGDFDLDPALSAAANKTVQATHYFTIVDKGQDQAWAGRIWCNPPYGGLSGSFAEKLVREFTAGAVTAAVLLVNANSTDAQWFQPLWNYLLCFTNHRINFIAPNGDEVSGSTHGSVFVYFGDAPDRFVAEFANFGPVVKRIDP